MQAGARHELVKTKLLNWFMRRLPEDLETVELGWRPGGDMYSSSKLPRQASPMIEGASFASVLLRRFDEADKCHAPGRSGGDARCNGREERPCWGLRSS